MKRTFQRGLFRQGFVYISLRWVATFFPNSAWSCNRKTIRVSRKLEPLRMWLCRRPRQLDIIWLAALFWQSTEYVACSLHGSTLILKNKQNSIWEIRFKIIYAINLYCFFLPSDSKNVPLLWKVFECHLKTVIVFEESWQISSCLNWRGVYPLYW